MSKQRIIFILGVWVAILPFLGFPSSLKQVLFILSGLSLIGLSYFFPAGKKMDLSRKKEGDSSEIFVDNGHEHQNRETIPKPISNNPEIEKEEQRDKETPKESQPKSDTLDEEEKPTDEVSNS